ncbi:MAG: GlcNAc-PI de-N-acetylase [Elusimicrobia bacterium GWD2_63_28]|nr:MAG: GlcNAc-PI de-N-acetylase [Elusimicrobia bacterium GWD2_63_28]
MGKNILVVAVHPDDETLGCGGSLLRHKKNGDRVHWCIVSDMRESEGFSSAVIKRRAGEIKLVARAYGFDSVTNLHLPATAVDSVALGERVRLFSKVFNKVRPDTVYLPFSGDIHSDHRATFEAANVCVKTFRYPFCKCVLMMETLSETEYAVPGFGFAPNYFRDISSYIGKKMKIMGIYKSEMKPHPFPRSERSIHSLASFRGETAGCEYAESFMLLKWVD